MVICPKCQFANRERALTCGACDHALADESSPGESGTPDPQVFFSQSATAIGQLSRPRISVHGPETTAASLSAPLPAPMVEPILTPTPPPPDMQSLPSHPLTLPLRGAGATVTSSPAPPRPGTAVTIFDDSSALLRAVAELAGPLSVTPAPAPTPDPVVEPRPKLVVLRGQRVNAEYPLYEGRNTIGRFVDKPVDIDLLTQESEIQTWCSRLHAAITFGRGLILIEDLNSLNGTWVNGARINPGQQCHLKVNDVVQVGTVQMKLLVG